LIASGSPEKFRYADQAYLVDKARNRQGALEKTNPISLLTKIKHIGLKIENAEFRNRISGTWQL